MFKNSNYQSVNKSMKNEMKRYPTSICGPLLPLSRGEYNESEMEDITINKKNYKIDTYGNISGSFNNELIATTIVGGKTGTSNILSISPDYTDKNLNRRTNLGNPGSNEPKTKIGVLKNTGRLNYGIKATDMLAVDKINAMLMYSGSVASTGLAAVNDLCKFIAKLAVPPEFVPLICKIFILYNFYFF